MTSKKTVAAVDCCGHDYATQLPAKPPPSKPSFAPNRRGRKASPLFSSRPIYDEISTIPDSDELVCVICQWRFARTRTQSLLSDKVRAHIAAHFVVLSAANLVTPGDSRSLPRRRCPFCVDDIIFVDLTIFVIHLDQKHGAALLEHDARGGNYDSHIYGMFFKIKQEELMDTIGHYCVVCRVLVDNSEECVHNHLCSHLLMMLNFINRKTETDRMKWSNFNCALCPLKLQGVQEAVSHAMHSHKQSGLLHQLLTDNPSSANDIVACMRGALLKIFRGDCKRLLKILFMENKEFSARIAALHKTPSASLQALRSTSSEQSPEIVASCVTVNKRPLVHAVSLSNDAQASASSSNAAMAACQPPISAPIILNKRRKLAIKVVQPSIHASMLMPLDVDIPVSHGFAQPKREDTANSLEPIPERVRPWLVVNQRTKKVIKIELSEMDQQSVDNKNEIEKC